MTKLECQYPREYNGHPVACRKCAPCRIRRQREWKSRLLLERTQHDEVLFATVTYAPEHVPADGNLVPAHASLWIKRIRHHVGRSFRHYAVGEYGDLNGRPHYHALLFGLGLHDIPAVERAWAYGRSQVEVAGHGSIDYVTGYMCKAHGPARERDAGKVPEFARMSRRPAIGAGALPALAASALALHSLPLREALALTGDAPGAFSWRKRYRSIGRYLRRLLRVRLGMDPAEPRTAAELRSARRATRAAFASSTSEHLQQEALERAQSLSQAEIQNRTRRMRRRL